MLFHLCFNVALALGFIFFTAPIARIAERLLPSRPASDDPAKPRHLDPSALDTPALAISCAAREALRIGDVDRADAERHADRAASTNDRALAERLRKMDDIVDDLYTAVKLYLTQISREALEPSEGRRWADIVSFTINMEQVGDIIERIIIDVEDKKIDKGRNFSEAGMAEICDLHARLIANLRLGLVGVPQRRSQERAGAPRAEGAVPRPRARLRRLAPRAPDEPDDGEHRDVVAAPRPHLRPEADQFAHLLDRLSDPRAGRRAREDAPEGARAPRARGPRAPRRSGQRQAADGEPPQAGLAEAQAAFRVTWRRRVTELSLGVTLAVLGAGLLHAGWNALLKSAPGGDPMLDTATIVAGSGVCGLVVIPFVGIPDAAAWKFAAVSSLIHWAYYVTLAHAYRTGDLSFAYPLMRGTAPLIVTLLGIVFLREWPTPQVALGIVLISLGIVSIAFVRREPASAAAAGWALANAAIIAVYTLVDGAGARASGNALALRRAGSSFSRPFRSSPGSGCASAAAARSPTSARSWRRGLVGGAASLGAYGIVLWAMTRAPVAAVAALRETSVLFAALIGAVLLKEGFGLPRLAGAASVVAGVAALKL